MYIEIPTLIFLAIVALVAYFEYRSRKGEPIQKIPPEIKPYIFFVRRSLDEYQSLSWARQIKTNSITDLEEIHRRYQNGSKTGINSYDEYCHLLMTRYNDDSFVELWAMLFMYSTPTSLSGILSCSDSEKAFRHQLVKKIESYSPEEIPASFYEIFPLSRFFPDYKPSQNNK